MSNARSPRTPYDVIRWHAGGLAVLDQTRLPWAVEYAELAGLEAACEAIRVLRVRGAPAIGITAAYALALEAGRAVDLPLAESRRRLRAASDVLAATRPTAVNLRWALDRVLAATAAAEDSSGIARLACAAAEAIHADQIAADARMAALGAALLEGDGPATVITHCNTGPLATGGLGTALGAVIEGYRRGLVRDVLVDETRPRLQGALLTSWELRQHGVPHHVIADGAAAGLLASRGVGAAFVGADRIAANGDTANKVGTFALALGCRYHDVPFYVVAPLSTVDLETPDGSAIVIEERDESEVLTGGSAPLAAPGARALNPAFDVTPAELVTAIVTEAGVLRPPFGSALEAALAR
jgi:methylthioribose-1-phosphate isomerase